MTTKSAPRTEQNPFFTATETVIANPFATQAAPTGGETGYELVACGPAVDADEVEDARVSAVEVSIFWGSTTLTTQHLTPPRSFHVGEEMGANLPTDFLIPAEKLGATRAPLVLVRGQRVLAVIMPGTTGSITLPGRGKVTVAQAIAEGLTEPCAEMSGAHTIALPAAATASFKLGDFTFRVSSTAAGKRLARTLVGAASATALGFIGLSMFAHLAMLGGFAFFKPNMDDTSDDETRKDRDVLMQQLLKASAEREPEVVKEENNQPASDTAGGTGAQAKGESGVMGTTAATKSNGKYAVQKHDDSDPRLARERALSEAATFGLVGLLNAGIGGDMRAPTAPWGDITSNGKDAQSANGHMFGSSIDDAAGSGGLGLFGIGEGGGGKYEGVGVGNVGGLGHGGGLGDKDGIGRGTGPGGLGEHKVKPASVRPGTTTVSGHLPSETIQRIVRQSFGRFRLCYENGLKSNPSLQGRVAVRFVIDRNGGVANAGNGGSDLPDAAVVSCVVSAFTGLSFPAPEDGTVRVVYPISFAPGGLATNGRWQGVTALDRLAKAGGSGAVVIFEGSVELTTGRTSKLPRERPETPSPPAPHPQAPPRGEGS
jgi:hypothetical protein